MLYYRSQIPYNNKILKQGINCLKLFWLFVFGNIFDIFVILLLSSIGIRIIKKMQTNLWNIKNSK